MIVDGKQLPAGTVVEADICIVGAGPAGISLATNYAKRSGVTVALIESGGMEFDAETQELAHSDIVGQEYFPMKETRLRVFGGSSLSWGGIGGEFTELDFQERSWVPNSGWPFGKSELAPYYERGMKVAQMDPDTIDTDPDDAPPAKGAKWSNVLFSAPTRFGKVYKQEMEDSKSVTVYLNSTVTKVELHADGHHVDGLQLSCLGGNTYRVVAGTYVLAGGGIENARMLMLSNDVATAGIGNEHDLLGRYFQEHPRMKDRYMLPEGTAELCRRIQGAAGTLRFSRIAVSEEAQREEGLLNYFANLSFGYAAQDAPQFDAVRRIVNASRSPWSDSPYYQDIGGGPNRVRWEDIKTVLKRPDKAFVGAFGAQFSAEVHPPLARCAEQRRDGSETGEPARHRRQEGRLWSPVGSGRVEPAPGRGTVIPPRVGDNPWGNGPARTRGQQELDRRRYAMAERCDRDLAPHRYYQDAQRPQIRRGRFRLQGAWHRQSVSRREQCLPDWWSHRPDADDRGLVPPSLRPPEGEGRGLAGDHPLVLASLRCGYGTEGRKNLLGRRSAAVQLLLAASAR